MANEDINMMPPEPSAPMPPEPSPTMLNDEMGPEMAEGMKAPDQNIQIVLLSRLQSMSPEELQELDKIIDSNTARILMKLLPELEQLISGVMDQGAPAATEEDMGALGGMM